MVVVPVCRRRRRRCNVMFPFVAGTQMPSAVAAERGEAGAEINEKEEREGEDHNERCARTKPDQPSRAETQGGRIMRVRTKPRQVADGVHVQQNPREVSA